MRLSNLDDCIQDALSTREKLTSQINSLLEDQKPSLDIINSASQAEEYLASTNRSLASCQKQIRVAQTRRSDLQASLETRRSAIASGKATQVKAEKELASEQTHISSRRMLLQQKQADLSGQIRRIGEDLSSIYRIASMESGSLSFTIRGLHLPNAGAPSESPNIDPAVTAAALGLVAHASHLLSFYLSSPLPYPITPFGSTSTILDPVSANMPSVAARTFPLYQKGAVTYRFEYGVFLLNSNIELLMSRQGSRLVDLRHTLPNLKYLLTVLTAGQGELPVRKKGEVKALENGTAKDLRRQGNDLPSAEKVVQPNGKQVLTETRGLLSNEHV